MAVAGSLIVELGANVARLQRDMRQANQVVQSSAAQMQRSLSAAGAAFRGLGAGLGGLGLALGIQNMTSAIVEAGIKAQQLDNAFKAISGSGAAKEIQFIRDETQRLGAEFLSTADAYKSLAAASMGTALQGEETRKVFTAITEASTVLGLSADQTSGALYAIGQMMSKGKVQAEELRGQLGERLPGAFQIAADAMNMTTAELDKFMADGKLMAEDFLPKFAAALGERYSGSVAGAASSAQAEINRLRNASTELKQDLADGLLPIFTDVVKALTEVTEVAKQGGQAIKALEGVHQVGIEVQISTNAAQAQADIQNFLRSNGIGQSAPARAMDRLFSWMGAASKQGASGWFSTPWPGDSLTAGDRHSQGKNLRIGLGQTGMEQAHIQIVKGAARAQREYAESVAEAEKRVSGYKTKLRELTEKQADLNLLQKAGKADTDEFRDASEKLKQEWEALYKVGSKGGGRGGGGMNEYLAEAKRIYADTRTEAERYAEEMQRLNAIYRSGYLDLDTYTRATTKLNAELNAGAMTSARTQADAIANLYAGAQGTSQLGDAGIKFGGAANAMASARWEDHIRELEAVGDKYLWLQQGIEDFAMGSANAITAFATSGKLSFEEFGRSVIKVLQQVATQMLVTGLVKLIGNAAGSYFGGGSGGSSYSSMSSGFNVGFRASGGPVSAMAPYIVGERGPELFVPKTAGYVHPSGTNLGSNIQTTINVNAQLPRGTGDPETDKSHANMMGREIARVVRDEFVKNLVREQRAGGMLNRGVSV